MSDLGPLSIAALIGEPTRARMLEWLLGGQSLTAKELACAAGVSAPTASEHLAKLVSGGLLQRSSRGRHRYYALASPALAHTLEQLMTLGPPKRFRPRSARDARLIEARVCYDHLAGQVAVDIAACVVRLGALTLTPEHAFVPDQRRDVWHRLGVAPSDARRWRGQPCLDWTERRLHVGGSLGAELMLRLMERRWLTREPRSRAVVVTASGRRGLREALGWTPRPDEAGSQTDPT
jgi:DNA-binding transcriptional ArsR family regulator